MTVFEAVSPTVNEPIDAMFCDSVCARSTEESALDRWTNEGGALYDSRFVPRHKHLRGITQNDSKLESNSAPMATRVTPISKGRHGR
jgi:hypothetical protein